MDFRDAIEQFSGTYAVVRTINSGVHVGTIGQVIPGSGQGWMVVIENARRIRDWKGAFTLSELAHEGLDANGSRLSIEVPKVCVLDAIEILPCSGKVEKLLRGIAPCRP